uniref:Transcription initiation factor IIA subunit 1 n=1 Tax=Trichuris muris TaxID=70415 RepID=A0A5S6Q0I5_TRIMR
MSTFHNSNPVNRIYRSVIDDVCSNSREGFLDEGLDEQVLQEFKHAWETKVLSTKAIDSFSENLNTGPIRSSYVAPVPASSHGVRIPMMSSLQLSTQALPSNIALPAGLVAGAPSGFVIQPLAGSQIRYLPNAAAVQGRPFMTKIVGAAPPSAIASMVNKPVAQVDRSAAADRAGPVYQVDGPAGVSDTEDAADEEDPEDFEEEEEEDFTNAGPVEDGDPLNSDDDLSFEDETEMFEADNVAACQYEKVNRTRNKWKFVFKDGIMNINGKDYVFNRASGEAEF